MAGTFAIMIHGERMSDGWKILNFFGNDYEWVGSPYGKLVESHHSEIWYG